LRIIRQNAFRAEAWAVAWLVIESHEPRKNPRQILRAEPCRRCGCLHEDQIWRMGSPVRPNCNA
jgi:hypothetical protein